MNEEYIVSVQSQVCEGFCGNSVASFVLRRRGHNPRIINTVQYFSKLKHVGYEISENVLNTLFSELSEGVKTLNNRNVYFLTGYIRTKGCVELVIDYIKKLKAARIKVANASPSKFTYSIENLINLNFFWLCDPVMGDNNKVYVDPEIVNVYKNEIGYADIITPNQYELELLTDIKINNERDVINALTLLLDKGVKIVIVTSVKYNIDKDYLYLYTAFYDHMNKLVCCKYQFTKYDFNICGTGDLFSSLLLSFIIKRRGSIFEIISKVLSIMQICVRNSINSVELHIIENQDLIASDGSIDNVIKEEFI